MNKRGITWTWALRLTWGYLWRVFLYTVLGGAFVRVLFELIGTATSLDKDILSGCSGLLTLAVSLFVLVYAMQRLTRQRFGRFYLGLIPCDCATMEKRPE
jgi:hypothetical protein